MVNREDVLALLEGESLSTGELSKYLSQPNPRVVAALRAMAREGLVTRVGAAKRWALANQATATARNPAASEGAKPDVDDIAIAEDEAGQDDPDVEALEDFEPAVTRRVKAALRQPNNRPRTIGVPGDGSGSSRRSRSAGSMSGRCRPLRGFRHPQPEQETKMAAIITEVVLGIDTRSPTLTTVTIRYASGRKRVATPGDHDKAMAIYWAARRRLEASLDRKD